VSVCPLVKGMLVQISNDCSETHRRYTLVDKMKPLLGTIQKVSSVSFDNVTVVINGYNWYSGDLIPVNNQEDENPIEYKPVTFDSENLNV
jgi:hypothetical protein